MLPERATLHKWNGGIGVRIRQGIALLLALSMLWPAAALADAEITVSARAAILMERESGRVLLAQNADERYPMASTTKVMTALIAVEHCAMDEIVTAGKNASGVTGTSIYLSEGEQLTMEQMLLGLMLRSGNDAAVAIAEHIGGTVEGFAALMNARAAQLGADAVFVTPNGLDAKGHGASARAMALIAREAMGNERFRKIVSTQEAVIPWVSSEYSRVLRNKNRLLHEYDGATGIKTGFTSAAGRCLVFSAERDGMELIGVVLSCPGWFDEATRMLDWGFEHFSREIAAQAGDSMAEAKVSGGEKKSVALCARQTLSYPLCAGDVWEIQMEAEQTLTAPVSAGQVCGRAALVVNGERAAETDLVAAEDIPAWNFATALRKILNFWPFRLEN